MGLGRFLQKTVGKVVGIKGRGSARPTGGPIARVVSATQSQAPGSAGMGGSGISKEVQDAADVQQRMSQAVGRAFKKGGSVSSGRGDGIAVRGKTKCKMY